MVEILLHRYNFLMHDGKRPECMIVPVFPPHYLNGLFIELRVLTQPVDVLQIERTAGVKDVSRAHEFKDVGDWSSGKHIFYVFFVDWSLVTLHYQGV